MHIYFSDHLLEPLNNQGQAIVPVSMNRNKSLNLHFLSVGYRAAGDLCSGPIYFAPLRCLYGQADCLNFFGVLVWLKPL